MQKRVAPGEVRSGPDRDCAQLVMCNFRPFGLNADRCINLVRVCSGHWKFVAFGTLSCRIPHILRKFGPSSRNSSFYCALLDPSRLCISCVHLCSRHSKLVAFRRIDLQHALYFGLEHLPRRGHVHGNAHITSSLGHRAAYAFRRRTSCICRQFWMGIRAQNGRSHRM